MNESLRQVLSGFLVMLLMAVIIVGSVLTAGVEGGINQFTLSPQEETGETSPTIIVIQSTPTPTKILEPQEEVTNATQTSTQTATSTMTRTATQTKTPASNLTPTITSPVCEPPTGWIQYTVQSGDTLYQLSFRYRTSTAQLQRANCMGSSTAIKTWQQLWVPNVATLTPNSTSTATQQYKTNTPVTAVTATPTSTTTPIGTETATQTSMPTATATATFTATTMSTATSTFTPTNTPQPPTETPTPTLTATETSP